MSRTLVLWMTACAWALLSAATGPPESSTSNLLVDHHSSEVLVSTSTTALTHRETAGPDTFYLYGGPGTLEGKFEDAAGLPDRQGWIGVDLTDQLVHWQISDFNAANLGGHGAGNLAYWCGQDATQVEGWNHTPGYGNNWNDILIYESTPVADPSVGQTVALDFFFNHDSEPGYDYFTVAYDSAGYWAPLLRLDGSNRDSLNVFNAPGAQFSTHPANNGHGIVYTGNDYGGVNGNQIRIRLQFTSDGAWSDEDGLWTTVGGAVQVDDISVSSSVESFVQDHSVVTDKFVPDKTPFAGDFSAVYPLFSDLDPCVDNTTPVIGFIDYGQEPPNGPGVGGLASTGGSLGSTSYGIPGGWVVNYTGGLSLGVVALNNEVWSPPISWHPGVAIANPEEVVGSIFRFSVYEHLTILNGIFRVWHIRSRQTGAAWSTWEDRNFVYYSSTPRWNESVNDVTDLLIDNPDEVQLALGVIDLAGVFGFPGNDATPSPVFDNVALVRYRIGGPVLTTRQIDLSNDGFPVSGTLDVSTQAGRDALDIPFDMARDVSTGTLNTPGDSITVDVASKIPGATVSDVRMVWSLKTNAVFEDAIRAAPARPQDQNVVAGPAGTVWTGEVVGDTARTQLGDPVDGRFFFDLPDVDFLYPGDHLEYYIRATDSDGRVTTLPADVSGFGAHDGTYDRGFVVRGLPSITDTAGDHPEILIWNDFGHRGGENDFLSSMAALGFAEGVDYDTYTTNGPSSLVGNGLGSGGAHGASVTQVAGYSTILYFGGDLSTGLISDGTDIGGNDKSNDLGLLTAWHALPGNRHVAYFGDYVSSSLAQNSPVDGAAYLSTLMGVVLNDADVRDDIDDQTAPVVRPTGLIPQFLTEFVAFGGCPGINRFDNISPIAGAVASHEFVDPLGGPGYDIPKGAVVYSRLDGGARKIDVTFPYSMMSIYEKMNRAPVANSARTRVFEELFNLFSVPVPGGSPITGSTPSRPGPELAVAPNPFNPATTIEFANVLGQRGTVKVYNLRGELVTTLHDGEFTTETLRWDGRDARGASVASGVYVVEATAGATRLTKKVALVK